MKNKNVHFVGIKGVGMAPLAIIAKEAGFKVTGCDIDEEFITDEPLSNAGIDVKTEFSKSHIEDASLVITTGAHGGFDNEEVLSAKEKGITIWTQGQAVGEFMKGEIFNRAFEGVSVAGSHGKTTTTAIIATILKASRLDPSFLVGTGTIKSLGSMGHFGKGKFFIAEADEYATEPKYDKKPKFLWQSPQILVVTNIELDHPDMFGSVEELGSAFLKLTENVKDCIVGCIDDPEFRKLKDSADKKIITYGFSKDADFALDRVSIEGEKMFFWISNKGTSLGEFVLNIVGEHNALNATAAVIVCLELGVSMQDIKQGLLQFIGTKRRFEFIKKLESGALFYDDYAHHPTEIRKTLQAFKLSHPGKKILCIFQPHTYSRTKKLFEQFISSFGGVDELILLDIYSSLREAPDSSISSIMLKDRISSKGQSVLYFPNLQDVVKYVVQKDYDDKWIIVTMGAGNVYKIVEDLK